MTSSHERDATPSGDQSNYGPSIPGPPPPYDPGQYGPPAHYGPPEQYGPPGRYTQPGPYGQPGQYGQQLPPPPPQQQPYPPQPGYAPPPVWVAPVPVYPYAVWIRRVGGYLVDFAPAIVAQIPFLIGYVMFSVRLVQLSATTTSSDEAPSDLTGAPLTWMIVGLVMMLAAFGWQWYNRWLVAGRTGQSMGKRVVHTKLVAEVNGQPIGPVNAFLRDLLHVLDGVAYIGFLWPLWDAKRQTFADMIMKTVVVDLRVTPDPGVASGDGHGTPRPEVAA